MKAFNKRKRTKNSFKGRYRFVGSGYRFCQAGDMWKWKVLHDFRIRGEEIKAFVSDAEYAVKKLGEARVQGDFLFNFHRCFAIKRRIKNEIYNFEE